MAVNIHVSLSKSNTNVSTSGVVNTPKTNNNSIGLSDNVKTNNQVETPTISVSASKITAISMATNVVRQTLNYASSNIGKWTGSNATQQKMNNFQEGIGMLALAYTSPTLALITVGTRIATTAIDNYYEQKWDSISVSNARAKAGYNSSNDVVGRRH